MPEVRTQLEGLLMFVQASGSGASWATASAPASGVLGYVQDVSFTSAQTITTVKDRGIPTHHKMVERDPISVSFSFLWTGSALSTPASGSGASVPMYHMELRASAPEMVGSPSAWYYQFYGIPIQSVDFREQRDGDQISFRSVALGMNGPTASGYLK